MDCHCQRLTLRRAGLDGLFRVEAVDVSLKAVAATRAATYPASACNPHGWVSPYRFGINEGPTVLMIENYRSELIWRLMKKSPSMVRGLRRAGRRSSRSSAPLVSICDDTQDPESTHAFESRTPRLFAGNKKSGTAAAQA